MRSSLVALLVVASSLAGLLQPISIRPGSALPTPTTINSWSLQPGGGPGGNPTVIVGRTEIDFRMEKELGVTAPVTYYLTNTATGTQVFRDEGSNWIGDYGTSSVAVHVAGDSDLEIIAVTPQNNLKCMRRDGTEVWHRSYTYQLGCPALSDLDEDGNWEIIFGRYVSGTDEIVILNAEDGTDYGTVPLASSAVPYAAPVVGDVDNDGALEIVITGSGNRRVYSASPTGSVEWIASLPDESSSSPILGDFDADGEVEVVAVTKSGSVCYLSGSDGTRERTVGVGMLVRASPVAGDINGDGYLEVIVSGIGNKIAVLQWDGSQTSWTSNPNPASSRFSTPAIADTNGDNLPEVITVDSHLRVFNWGGQTDAFTPGSGWFADTQGYGLSPVVFDSNSNGFLDIVYFMQNSDTARLLRIATTTSSSARKWVTYKNDFRRSGVFGSDTYGVDPDMAIDNRNWTYGNVSAGSMQYKDFTITNYGQVTLTGQCIDTAKIDINDTALFSIPSGSSKGFRATFDTSDQGIITGFVVVRNINDPDEPMINVSATANITQPEHDIAAHQLHVAGQLNPNYVNVPPIKVEFRNLGQFWEGGITTNLTINGILAPSLTPDTFDLNPGEARNVTFYWDRTNPALDGEGSFTLVSKAQNVNLSIEADVANNVVSRVVEVTYPIAIQSVTSWLAQNLTHYVPYDNFTEGDSMHLRVVYSNEWSVPVTLIPVILVVDATGSPLPEYRWSLWEMTMAPGEERTVWPGVWLSRDIESDTKYNATVYAYDSLGGGTKILADPYVHTFWVEPNGS
jgi:hypothetical protein